MIVPRLPRWEQRLQSVIDAWQGRRHQPRAGQDCASFAAACVVAVTGFDPWPAGLRRYRSVAGQVRALRRQGWRDLMAAADACLGDAIPPLAAQRGDIVSDGSVLAVMTASGPLALGEDGMAYLARDSIVRAWVIGRADAPAPMAGPA